MLNAKHVLVLGAGASQPYGFPIGVELSKLVSTELRPGHNGYNHLQKAGVPEDKIVDFRNAFFHSGKNSVDAFLEHRTDLIDIGKLVTACVLIPFEREDNLFSYENSWLRYVYNNLNTSFEEFGSNQLAIVTFNYDRTVEHFFFTSLRNSYGKNPDECFRALENIPIIHLHGTLSPLPWQASKGTRPFDFKVSPEAIHIAADNIKIIHEDIKDGRDKEFERAKALINAAERVLFMGFGYNSTNMERLGIKGIARKKALGTCVGMGDYEKRATIKASDERIHFMGGDCLHFVRELIQW